MYIGTHTHVRACRYICLDTHTHVNRSVGKQTDVDTSMGWLRVVGSIKSDGSFAKEPYKTDDILQERLII